MRWSPATVNPPLRMGDSLAVRKVWPPRAPILGSDGTPLTGSAQGVIVGVVGDRVKHASAVRRPADGKATRAEVSQALAQAAAHPTEFEPVFTVSPARFGQLESQPGRRNVYSVRGTAFERTSSSAAIIPQQAVHLVARWEQSPLRS